MMSRAELALVCDVGRAARRARRASGGARQCLRHAGAADFDVVVVGAGPAGSAAALTLARAGRRVALLERGPYPGSKNMYGGVVYGRVLDDLIPGWYDEAPMQRWITRRQTMIVTGTQALTVDYRTTAWGEAPYNGATTYRADFDSWLAGKAEAAGAVLLTSTTATGLLRDESGRIAGVTTDRPDGDLRARLVIACDGVNSFLAKAAGLYPNFSAENFTLGAKEVLALPREEIDARFGVRGTRRRRHRNRRLHDGNSGRRIRLHESRHGVGRDRGQRQRPRRRQGPARGAHRRAEGASRPSRRWSRAASSRSTAPT